MSGDSWKPREHHHTRTHGYSRGTLLDVVCTENENWLFFSRDTDSESISIPENLTELQRFTIGNCPVISTTAPQEIQPILISIAGEKRLVQPRPSQKAAFTGMNVLFAEVNGQPPETVLKWLEYYTKYHQLQGALLLFRDDASGDINEVIRLSQTLPDLKRLICLDFDTPLGAPDLPSATHPFNCFSAPGKDRMERPAADPQTSPLAALHLCEYARHAYLGDAAAVANLDVSDFIPPLDGSTLFDEVKKRQADYLRLEGIPCFPWRPRNIEQPQFGDHICHQFDQPRIVPRWCLIPARISPSARWRIRGIPRATPEIATPLQFYRAMAIRHPNVEVGKIAPKSSLIVDRDLQNISTRTLGYDPILPPKVERPANIREGSVTVVTTMKNEGPFLLEWLAYHRVIGVTDFLVYTNDCDDGTDTFFDLLQEKGYLQHRENPYRTSGQKPQHAALFAASQEDLVKSSDWLVCIDVDEFITIKAGDGTLKGLFNAAPNANMISMTWRLFGNGNHDDFNDELTTETYTNCAPEFCPRPHQAWGFKTLYRNNGIFRKMGVHRPKGLNAQLVDEVNWVNGSGSPMPRGEYRNAWRSSKKTFGYDLVSLNHYAVRNSESFLVKRDRGRVNHVDRDQGLAYWFRMNNNAEEDRSIHRMLPALKAELERLKSDPEIAAAHAYSVRKHRAKIDQLLTSSKNREFFNEISGDRMRRLSRLHRYFGMNVFLAGPESVPDDVVNGDLPDDFFFTVEKTETKH
ncbi:Glycosyl transferase family 2 [Aliiroseovarius halocynthiae]|uniref:Glycosyltransferase family 2 protein n=1 Tax=Aliiroseovarius halocynthiae TaxID=985055 RepID=A0A545SQD3_9RHOB|nr:glycosyltransferase family 2 protein [Aliiroseovarius halocynthiae]TQV67189.1 glycosyltransferase family 2 protein [Aliiroseovarius halocynthiae]SMR82080.1 Glycosyl transferase family 2 [Aliiroseovarius halocynthiae]